MLFDIIFIAGMVISLIIGFVCAIKYGEVDERVVLCLVCFSFLFIATSSFGALERKYSYTEIVEVDPVVSTNSYNLYALKDNANGISTTSFILGQATTNAYTTYTFLTDDEENEGLKKVETVSTYGNEILFDDSLANPSDARLDVVTTKVTVKRVPEELTLRKNLLIPGYFARNLFLNKNGYTKTTQKYIFVVPKDSIAYEYNIDLE